MSMESAGPEREVYPPGTNDPTVPNRIVSVVLQPGERVRWWWSITADGRRYVSGYTVLPAWRRPRRPRPPRRPKAPPQG